MAPTGEPRQSPKPQPMGDTTLVLLFTTCTVCILFLIWRKADSLKRVVSHQLKTFSEPEGRIRLSEDDGPPTHTFIQDDDEEDDDGDLVLNAPQPLDRSGTATRSLRL